MEQGNLDSWDGFLGSNFLKAKDVTSQDVFTVVGVEMDTENNKPALNLESKGVASKFTLNVTNSNFLKNAGFNSPKEIVGKSLTFEQHQTPKGLGLLITKVE